MNFTFTDKCSFGFVAAVSLALLLAHFVISSLLRHSKQHSFTKASTTMNPPTKDSAASHRVFTIDDISICNGDASKNSKNRFGFSSAQILLCVNGEVYEATTHPSGKDFYGPGKAYNVFAGCDSTVALARVKIDKELCNTWNWNEVLTNDESKTLSDWILKFRSKYEFVGRLQEAENHKLDLSRYNCPSWP